MKLLSIDLVNFKNYENEHFDFDSRVTIITGNNGMGKTNLLDAIYYAALGKSYFSFSDKSVVRTEAEFFRLVARYDDLSDAGGQIIVKVRPGLQKEVEVNGIKSVKLGDHIGLMPVVFITPDDVHTLLSGNEERRIFLNNTIVQYDKQYIDHLTVYNKLLKQRNALLKDFQDRRYYDEALLEVITMAMASPGQYIYEARKRLIDQMMPFFQSYYSLVSGGNEKCDVHYISQLGSGDFKKLSHAALEKDRILCRSGVGIHKDEIQMFMDGLNLRESASQGQLKSCIIALKLAQHAVLKTNTKKTPLILLDDVFDKLDPHRVHRLLSLVSGTDFGQVFITDSHTGRVELSIGSGISCGHFLIADGANASDNLS
ncbi:MAG: DNA replication and repair protein RecF [Saprospiraceae bacterium]|nr:DNA replication and repair protein RecF [Saprospiraceae bacterium]